MPEHHIPKGVSLDTLREILAGWAEAGADTEPRYTSAVEEHTDVSDVVGRQTRFLEELGVLEPQQQKHRLTDVGATLADALANGDEERAREQARTLLADWPPTEDVRDVLAENPTDEETLVRLVAGLAEQDLDAARVESGISTLLDAYEWTGLLERDEEGRYRLPAEGSGAEASERSATDDAATADIDTVRDAIEDVAETAEAAKATAEEAKAAATAAQAAGEGVDTDAGSHPHALSLDLDLDVDADAEDLEALVRGIREGATNDPDDERE